MNTTNSISNQSYDFTLITSVILTIVGLTGNSITIFIMAKPEMRRVSIFRYLMISMINDCLVLFTMWFFTFPQIFQNNSIGCKLSTYLSTLVYNYSGWIMVASLVDRFFKVKYPTKKFHNQNKFHSLVLIITFTILIFLSIPNYSYYDIYESICITTDANVEFYVELSGALIGVIIPFFLMIIITIMIGHSLIKKRKNIQNRKELKKEIRLIKMMISMSLFFLICNLPYFIQQLIHDTLSFHNQNLFNSDYIFNFVFNATNQVTFIYNSFGFFVCLLTNNIFRNYVCPKFSKINNSVI